MKTGNLTRVTIFAVGVTAFSLYAATAAPGLTWENFGVDGGELMTAAATLGVPHPPGYPTYVVLGKLFSFLPIGTIAFRFNLFSAFCTAVAAGFVTATAVSLSASHTNRTNALPAAAAAGLSFAFAPLVWSQATIAEVYGLNLAVLAILLWALVTERSPFLIGVLFGLSLTTHITSLFFSPLVFLHTKKQGRKLFASWFVSWLVSWFVGLLVGLLPYLLIFLLARSNSPIVWGNADTVSGWWWLVSG